LCSPDTKVGKVTSSNLTHNDGHIHHASPIWGLPPEPSKPAHIGSEWQDEIYQLTTGPQRMLQGSIGDQAGGSASMQPTQSNGDWGTDGRTFSHQHKALSPPMLPDASKEPAAAMQATDEWFANQDQLQQATKKHPPNPLGHSGSTASTGMAEEKTSFEPKNIPLSSSASKQATKKVSWATGFLNKQKTA